DGRVIVVPPTLLISAMGVIEDVRQTVTMDAKRAGDVVFVVGETFDECGGSRWYRALSLLGTRVPVVRGTARRTLEGIESEVALGRVPSRAGRSDRVLFSESTTRFLVEVEASRAAAFSRHIASRGVVAAEVGTVVETPRLVIRSVEGYRDVVSAPFDELAN